MAKLTTKLYKYDSSQEVNGYKGEDFSQYILQGDSDIDNLDDTLDTGEITLAGLSFREEFAPTTKFIIEKYQEQLNENNEPVQVLWKTFHWEVSSDTVEQPILSDNNYFNHSISFIEPSVEAQQRLVDNIAVTYRLKDVSLESAPTYDTQAKAIKKQTDVVFEPPENFGNFSGFLNWETRRIGHQFKWVMPNWYQVTINGVTKTPSWDDWNNFLLNQEIPSDQTTTTVELPIPMLECQCAVSNTKNFRHNGYCSIQVQVEETSIYNNQSSIIQTIEVHPNQNDPNESWTPDEMLPALSGYGWIESRPYATRTGGGSVPVINVSTGAIIHRRTRVAVPTTTTTNRVINFQIRAGCSYRLILRRLPITNPDLSTSEYHPYLDFANNSDKYDVYPNYYAFSNYTSYIVAITTTNDDQNFINDDYPSLSLSFNSVLAGTNYSIYLRSAPTENALNLFNKAQLTTQNIKKIPEIIVDETPKTFYLEDANKQELQNTTLVENFYNQKNLWEVFMDIGKYIHARPKVEFGSDNRYVVKWKKYGRTDQQTDMSNTISVYNSRFVEEYISACSSYVANMVQLGGIITETIAPKSSSSDYLVYNDVAEIVTEKNIIELIKLEVIRKPDNETKDITEYVFEENVYNLLSINENTNINKGLAIYYKLGTNKIVGLNYRLPTINTGDGANDYAIKRIIGKAFLQVPSTWKNIKINDYLFKITYRTKDTLRSDQVRPDLRKYLRASKYDRVPQHNQFNNQQDVVVDSVKFGNNIYGKLIRTGNKVYTKLEWVDGLSSLKKSGDLYMLQGDDGQDEWFYVSKVKNTYFYDHIISEVEFSKDFNRLSEIIGIPSEPRFFEISEQSLIKREISLDDYIILGTQRYSSWFPYIPSFIRGYYGWSYIANMLLGEGQNYPKYALTIFKNDIDKETVAGNETFKVETLTPVCTYSIENTLTIEWDMKDNFSAGDQVSATAQSFDDPVDTAYYTLLPYRYCDVYGRCDMIDFAIMKDYTFNDNDEVMNLPANPIDLDTQSAYQNLVFGNQYLYINDNYPSQNQNNYGTNDSGLIVLKDCREALSFNYNLQMLTDSDRFVLSAYMWQENKENLRIGLLKEEINKISNATITNGAFAIENIPISYVVSQVVQQDIPPEFELFFIDIRIQDCITNYAQSQGKTVDEVMEGINAIIIYSTNEVNDYVNSGAKYFVMGRNVGGLSVSDAIADWTISHPSSTYFTKQ